MKHRKYIYTNKKNSERAIMSVILGMISTVSLGIVVYLSYAKGGDAPAGYGMTALLAAIFSLVGLVLGLITMQDKDYFKLFPVLGIILNLAALGAVAFLLRLGL